ncbi:MAG: hypothetical protein HQL37_11320 [Alphaproteobacteria bacterium]|nr:hypothetical protein [Alphaproteobacteria bacterium]
MGASAILKLQTAGFSIEQVTALAELVDLQAASKTDLLEAKTALKTDLQAAEHRLETKISDLRIELKTDIVASKIDTIKWTFGLLLAQTGLFLAGLKLFLH